jgi:hypothetical protein
MHLQTGCQIFGERKQAHTPQEEHWQLEPQLQEEGPVHWQGPILFDGDLILGKSWKFV